MADPDPRTKARKVHKVAKNADQDDDDDNEYVFECLICGDVATFDADEEGSRDEARSEFMEHARGEHEGVTRYELREK